ncbi:MAG TPA: SPOR domain-containing protein [Marinagarivorans sp.]
MRWFFLSLVLVNAAFFCWRFLGVLQSPGAHDAASAVPEAGALSALAAEPDAARITLLEELGGQSSPSANLDDAASESPSSPLIPTARQGAEPSRQGTETETYGAMCYWAGPLSTDVQRDLLLKRLKGLRIDVSEHVARSSGDRRYWVYLPPMASRAEAKQQLAELQARNIDSYLIRKGERKNGISLGLYSRAELANSRADEVRAIGWEPTIDAYTQTLNQLWIAASKRQVDAVGEGILPRMLKNKSSVTIIEKKCALPVASHNNIH